MHARMQTGKEMINFKLQLFRIPQCVRKLMDVEYYADLDAVLH